MGKQQNKPAATAVAKPVAVAAVGRVPVVAVARAAPAAAPAVVALRGGAAVTKVQLVAGAVYRTKAPHNVRWWQAVQAAVASGPAPVAALVAAAPAGSGVPTHFVGYCLRRGYLQAA